MGIFDLLRKKEKTTTPHSSGGREPVARDMGSVEESRYVFLCALRKENTAILSHVNYYMGKGYEDYCGIYINPENGAPVFVHEALISMGAGSTSQVIFSKEISFQTMKTLVAWEMGQYRVLISKWEQENDPARAASCKESLQKLERILSAAPADLNGLTSI